MGPIEQQPPAGFVSSPFLTIWTKPRVTIRQIVDKDPGYMVIWIMIAGGLASAIGTVWDAYIYLPILFLISLFIGGAMVQIIAKGRKGTGNQAMVRASIAWGFFPQLIGSLLRGGWILLGLKFNLVTSFIEWVIIIYSMVITAKCVSEVNGFSSAWKGAYALLLGGILASIPVIVIYI